MAALELPKKPLRRLDENKMKLGLEELETDLNDGKHIAYVSDAGMPGVSDPGLQIACLAREKSFPLEVLPGPSAAVLAYVHSGFEAEGFYFAGFLPRKEGQIVDMIKELQNLQAALIFYESPKRIIKTLEVFSKTLPNRKICLCRELTKLHEDVIFGTAEEVKTALLDRFTFPEQVKGEICFVVDVVQTKSDTRIDQLLDLAKGFLEDIKDSKLSNKDKSKLLVKYFGLDKNTAYELVLEEGK
ncbi:MAG: rRNA small subunit methyltransferase 1 [Eggerthellaceae bacterium]|nr:rRNA small subunit methyltransferase 1 [Eggerthellaceae bacterium]